MGCYIEKLSIVGNGVRAFYCADNYDPNGLNREFHWNDRKDIFSFDEEDRGSIEFFVGNFVLDTKDTFEDIEGFLQMAVTGNFGVVFDRIESLKKMSVRNNAWVRRVIRWSKRRRKWFDRRERYWVLRVAQHPYNMDRTVHF
jgi:hypothetical protein